MVLYPADPEYAPVDHDAFVDALRQRGLLGAYWRDNRYLVGHRFMQEIIFIGCSPFLRVDPQDDLPFCHLQLSIAAEPTFLRSPQAGSPRCPQCRAVLIADADVDYLRCSSCHQDFKPKDCYWRAGRTVWSRCDISIWTLQKGDAQPTASLLDFLQEISGVDWKTAFL